MIKMRNFRALTNIRTLSTIFIGMAAGIFGIDGLIGMIFFLIADVMVGILTLASIGFEAKPYFSSSFEVISKDLGAKFMTFMVCWVLFYNLVYVL